MSQPVTVTGIDGTELPLQPAVADALMLKPGDVVGPELFWRAMDLNCAALRASFDAKPHTAVESAAFGTAMDALERIVALHYAGVWAAPGGRH